MYYGFIGKLPPIIDYRKKQETASKAASRRFSIIPTRSLNRNLNQFELSFIACGISIISVVCQIWSI